MCGIVGYLGPQNPKEVILKGLRALEYRGYDSAGVAILHRGEFKRIRAEGKLSGLESKLQGEEFDGHLGIGHTRWATHGPPSEKNAHPHCVGGISIVHNGIIENYLELKEELSSRGAVFSSDTDSELVAHLLAAEFQKGQSLFQAVLQIMPRLRGAYSVVAVHQDEPKVIVAFKYGPPLIVGKNSREVLVASDIQAIVPYAQEVVHMEDHQVVVAKEADFKVYDERGHLLNPKTSTIQWTEQVAEKSGFPHFMLKEIHQQPLAVASALKALVDLNGPEVRFEGLSPSELSSVERVHVVACGTSYYAGMVAEYVIENLAQISVEVDIASEFRYRRPILEKSSTLAVLISQSGETADTLAALRMLNESGVRTLSVCNVKDSTIDREARFKSYMNAGLEIGVASTKAFVSSLAVVSALALALAKAKGRLKPKEERSLIEELLAIPAQMERVLNLSIFFKEAASHLKNFKGFLYMGRGVNYPIALEGALKLKELAYMHAEGYAAGEMKHGPLALIDDRMAVVMLAPQDGLYEKTISNLEEARARGGYIISLGSGQDERLKSISHQYLSLPKAGPLTNPFLEVIPLQLLAYYVADALGHDVDQPRNLAKSVTVE